MTAAERQRRRRKKLRAQQPAEVRQKLVKRSRDKHALKYMPMPPGITRWHQVTISPGQEVTIWQPEPVPLPMFDNELDDAEIIYVLGLLKWKAQKTRPRGRLGNASAC